jgi:hypothetical protein
MMITNCMSYYAGGNVGFALLVRRKCMFNKSIFQMLSTFN